MASASSNSLVPGVLDQTPAGFRPLPQARERPLVDSLRQAQPAPEVAQDVRKQRSARVVAHWAEAVATQPRHLLHRLLASFISLGQNAAVILHTPFFHILTHLRLAKAASVRNPTSFPIRCCCSISGNRSPSQASAYEVCPDGVSPPSSRLLGRIVALVIGGELEVPVVGAPLLWP
jgi:hypothetical protein